MSSQIRDQSKLRVSLFFVICPFQIMRKTKYRSKYSRTSRKRRLPKMSNLSRLRKVVAYESLDRTGSKFCRIRRHIVIAETYPLTEMFYSCETSISRKNPALPIEKFPSLVLPSNVIILQHLIIQFSLHYLSSGRLREWSLIIGGRGGPVNFGGGLCFFRRPFGVGHNFMGPRLGEGYNFWAPFIKTLGDVHKWVLCYWLKHGKRIFIESYTQSLIAQ